MANHPNSRAGFGFAGRYRLRTLRPDKSVGVDSGWFSNLITDAGLNRIGTGAWSTHCAVGTGNTAPTAADTSLDALLATTTTVIGTPTQGARTSPPYYGYRIITYNFAAGTATGNIAEVGVGWAGGLFSRALTVDGLGNPTQITVLADEVLEVIYEVRVYPPLDDYVYTATLAGVSTTCTARAAEVTNGISSGWGPSGDAIQIEAAAEGSPRVYAGSIGAITGSPSGLTGQSASRTTGAYSNNSYEIDLAASWALTVGNFAGGIAAVDFNTNGYGVYQIGFDPPIMKTATDALAMGFKVAWGRYDDESS